MGFKLGRTYKLVFEGDLAGAEVKVRSLSIGVMEEMRNAEDTRAAEIFADHVVEWNLEDAEGKPLPTTGEALVREVEPAVLRLLCAEWYKAAYGISAPLDGGSTSGEQFPEASIPME